MAKNTEPKPTTAAEVAASITEVDQSLLESTARFLYVEMTKAGVRGDGKRIAQTAYSRARDFVLVTQAIRDGATIPDTKEDAKPLWCKVRMWDGSKGLHGEPLVDDNNQPVFEVQPVDRDAFAPNLPAEHPINQRYLPNVLKNGTLCDVKGNALATAN